MSARLGTAALAVACLAAAACQSAPEPVPEERRFELVRLEFADALETSSTLRGLYEGTTMRVEVDARTNSVLLAGAVDDMAQAKDLIARLDVEIAALDPRGEFEIIVLEYALAADVQRSLRELMANSPTELAIDARTNALLVRAEPASMARIKDLIVRLDREQ